MLAAADTRGTRTMSHSDLLVSSSVQMQPTAVNDLVTIIDELVLVKLLVATTGGANYLVREEIGVRRLQDLIAA